MADKTNAAFKLRPSQDASGPANATMLIVGGTRPYLWIGDDDHFYASIDRRSELVRLRDGLTRALRRTKPAPRARKGGR